MRLCEADKERRMMCCLPGAGVQEDSGGDREGGFSGGSHGSERCR